MQGANAAELKSVRNKAADAIVDFIRFPDQYQFDLLEADAVVQLREDPDFGALYQLLSILLRSANIKVGRQYLYLDSNKIQSGSECVGRWCLCAANVCSTSYGAVVL